MNLVYYFVELRTVVSRIFCYISCCVRFLNIQAIGKYAEDFYRVDLGNETVKKIRVQVRRLKFISPASNNSIFCYKCIDDQLVDLPFYLTRISLVFLSLKPKETTHGTSKISTAVLEGSMKLFVSGRTSLANDVSLQKVSSLRSYV